MDIDRINDDRELFRENVVNIVQGKLQPLGIGQSPPPTWFCNFLG